MTLPAPTLGEEAQLRQAVTAAANRQVQLVMAALGLVGDEFGQARVLPPYNIDEMLYGLRRVPEWTVEDMAGLVSTDQVIRAGLGVEPSTFPVDRVPDVQQAIDSAAEWVRQRVWGAHGVA